MKIEVGQEYDYNPNLSSSYKKVVEFMKDSPYEPIELLRGKMTIRKIFIEDNITYIQIGIGGAVTLEEFIQCIEI